MSPKLQAVEKGKKKQKQKRVSLSEEVERMRTQLTRLAKSHRPVIAGPFTGEVGFELLYWIPLLRWAVREVPDLRGRLIVVSRGGAQDWFQGLDAQYVDILSLFPPEDFAEHRARSDKQRDVAEFEERVIARVIERMGLEEPEILHPSALYESYFRVLKINQLAYPRSLKHGEDGAEGLMSIYTPMNTPDVGNVLDFLPDEYVAVRFYSRPSFEDTPEARQFVRRVIESVTQRYDVVLLGDKLALDDHTDLEGEPLERTHEVSHLLTPDNNLRIQTAAVGRAKALVGTYGGFSYLAPFLGVPSISFSMDRAQTQPWHYELAQRIFDGPAWGDFVALSHSDLGLVQLVTGGFALDGVPSPSI